MIQNQSKQPTAILDFVSRKIQDHIFKDLPYEIDPTKFYQGEMDCNMSNEFLLKFFEKYIPILYGVNFYSANFKECCICEIARWHLFFNLPCNPKTIRSSWWKLNRPSEKMCIRTYIMCKTFTVFYTILFTLNIKIRYKIQRL